MKLSELKPCEDCGGKIAPIFAVVKARRLLIDHDAANRVLALSQMFGRNLLLAETMGDVNEVTVQLDDREIVLCQDCFLGRLGDVYLPEGGEKEE